MEARPRKDGLVTYRLHPRGGKPINLGTNKEEAIRRVLDLNRRAKDEGTFLQLWRLYKATPRWHRLAESTRDFYSECWGRLPGEKGPDDQGTGLARVWAFGVVSHAKPSDVARYLRVERAAAPVVANREVALLSNLFKLAVERGDIDRNPCKEVSRNPEEPRERVPDVEELQAFIAWALQQGESAIVLVSMAEFAALTGNRRIEFRTLHWPQVDESLVRLQRAKQRGTRQRREIVTVSDALRAVLARMKKLKGYSPMGAVFRAPRTNNPYSEPGFKAMWNRLMLKALAAEVIAERFTFHDLRAYYTTTYKQKFGVLPEIHADPATTARVYDRSQAVTRQAL